MQRKKTFEVLALGMMMLSLNNAMHCGTQGR